ncbi:hypothetical protein E2C01_065023 [Portunus trituberculatus]|uniref:Uncharacterized protein n=1 Tax=Portunus trituberculatus TaxID=210409 RepID=A0A5B7HLF2_PORTR|nr:hypothetical protein [Portunus trituberculatus]
MLSVSQCSPSFPFNASTHLLRLLLPRPNTPHSFIASPFPHAAPPPPSPPPSFSPG